MKNIIVAILCTIGFLGSAWFTYTQGEKGAFVQDVGALSSPPPPVDMPIVPDLGQVYRQMSHALPSNVITLPTQVITLTREVPVPGDKVELHWTCGIPHTMDQGPVGATVSDCHWQ